jgi:hypothetical protein
LPYPLESTSEAVLKRDEAFAVVVLCLSIHEGGCGAAGFALECGWIARLVIATLVGFVPASARAVCFSGFVSVVVISLIRLNVPARPDILVLWMCL